MHFKLTNKELYLAFKKNNQFIYEDTVKCSIFKEGVYVVASLCGSDQILTVLAHHEAQAALRAESAFLLPGPTSLFPPPPDADTSTNQEQDTTRSSTSTKRKTCVIS